jgi:hypothetical protein
VIKTRQRGSTYVDYSFPRICSASRAS